VEKAIVAYQEWAQLAPALALPHLRLGFLYGALGQYEQQAAEATTAMRLSQAAGQPAGGFSQLLRALHCNGPR